MGWEHYNRFSCCFLVFSTGLAHLSLAVLALIGTVLVVGVGVGVALPEGELVIANSQCLL